MGIFGSVWDWLGDVVEGVGDAFENFLAQLSGAMSGIARTIASVLDTAQALVQDAISALDDVVAAISNVVDGVLDGVQAALDAASAAFERLGQDAMRSVANQIIAANPEEYAQALESTRLDARAGEAESLIYTDNMGSQGLFTLFTHQDGGQTYRTQTTSVTGGDLANEHYAGPLGAIFAFLLGAKYRELDPAERFNIVTDVKLIPTEDEFGAVFVRFDAHELGNWSGQQIKFELRAPGAASALETENLGTFSANGEPGNSATIGVSPSGKVTWHRISENPEELDMRSGNDQNHQYTIRIDESLVNQLNGQLDIRIYTPTGGANRYLGVDNLEISQQFPSGYPGIAVSGLQADTFESEATSGGWQGGTVIENPSQAVFSKIYSDVGGNGISKIYKNDLPLNRLGTMVEFDLVVKKSLAQSQDLIVEFGGSRIEDRV